MNLKHVYFKGKLKTNTKYFLESVRELDNINELSKENKAFLESRDFIVWLLHDLNSNELSALLVSLGIEKEFRKQSKLPKAFLTNKLLLKSARQKLNEKKVLPPFQEFFEYKNKELSLDIILEIAHKSFFSKKKEVIVLFLQNYYIETLEKYKEYKESGENSFENEKEILEVKPQKEMKLTNEKKIDKKIERKIQNLEMQNQKLLEEIESLKEKNKNLVQQVKHDINQLNEKNLNIEKKYNEMVEENKTITNDLIQKKKEIEMLKEIIEEKDLLINPIIYVGYIGESKIIKNSNYYKHPPEFIELERIDNTNENETWEKYDEIHCLTFELTQGSLRKLRRNLPKQKLKEFNNINSLLMHLEKENLSG